MHIDDAHDDNLVAEETALHTHTRAQTRAADASKTLDDPIILTTSSDDQTESARLDTFFFMDRKMSVHAYVLLEKPELATFFFIASKNCIF